MDELLPVIRVAAVQAEPIALNREATTEKACSLIQEAASKGARLIVFPETFIPTYPDLFAWGKGLANFDTPRAKKAWARLWRNSVEIPGPTTDILSQAAVQAQAVIVMGINERTSVTNSLYNTALFIGPDGSLLGKHRKLVPTNHERMVWDAGDGSTLKVFNTPAGKLGSLICWENWMPLARYALYAQGEQIHLVPTADDSDLALVNARNTAAEGRVFVVSVCMLLRKSSYPVDFELNPELVDAPEFLETGGSAIVGPDGTVLAGPLWKEEGILYADLDLNRVVEEHQLLDVVGHYARPDVLSLRFDPSAKNALEKVQKPSNEGVD
jgi:nitrilase